MAKKKVKKIKKVIEPVVDPGIEPVVEPTVVESETVTDVEELVDEVKTPMNRTEFIHIVSAKTSEFLDKWKDAMRNSTSKRNVVDLRREFNQLKGEYMKSYDNEEKSKELLGDMDNMIVELGEM